MTDLEEWRFYSNLARISFKVKRQTARYFCRRTLKFNTCFLNTFNLMIFFVLQTVFTKELINDHT